MTNFLKTILFTVMLTFSFDSFAAFSATLGQQGQIGGLRFKIYELSFASVTSGTTITGMNNIIYAVFNNETTEAQGLVNKNSATASETEDDPGEIHISGVTSSDNGVLFVIGN